MVDQTRQCYASKCALSFLHYFNPLVVLKVRNRSVEDEKFRSCRELNCASSESPGSQLGPVGAWA